MYSHLPSDGDDSHRASGQRTFKAGVALGAGVGLLVGAIVALALFPSHATSADESSSLVALPASASSLSQAQALWPLGRSALRGPNEFQVRGGPVYSTNPDAPIKLGINGFGRIGRQVARIAMDREDFILKHINSPMSPDYMKYLLEH